MADETSTPQSAPQAASTESQPSRPYTPRPAYAGPGGARPPRPAGGGPGAGGPGGPGGGPGGRKFFRRKKVCKFCTETGVCTRHQRKVSQAIKQSRNIALLAFAARF